MKKYFSVKTIVVNALVAALYAVISILSGPLAFNGGALQLRLSEALSLLVFFNPSYTLGITLGCLITNIMSFYGWPDLIIGTLATLFSCLFIVLISKTLKNLFLCSVVPCVFNAFLVPFAIYIADMSHGFNAVYWISVMWVGLGEIIVLIIIGYPLFLLLSKKYKGFYSLINAVQNMDYKF